MKLGSIYMVVILAIGSIYDWKYLGLPVWLLLAGIMGGILGALYSLFGEDASVISVGMAFLPGVIALILSYITKEQIGYGDGLILLAMGGCLGMRQAMMIVGIALGASFVVSVALVLLRKAGRNQKLPFVPFLFAGWIMASGGGLLFG